MRYLTIDRVTVYITQHETLTYRYSGCVSNTAQEAYLLIQWLCI